MNNVALVLIGMAVLAVGTYMGVFLYWRLTYFLRDPPRQIPVESDKIVAAADGFITYVKRVTKGEIPISVKGIKSIRLVEFAALPEDERRDGFLIGTYMTEHSVHRNRAPVGGQVVLRQHRSAAPFNRSMARMAINLMFGKKPYDADCHYLMDNERLTIGIRHPRGVVTVTQIADLWVNRIVARIALGDLVKRGQQYGLIRFGSQCDVFLPDDLVERIVVQPGEYVYAGQSVVALMRSDVSSGGPV